MKQDHLEQQPLFHQLHTHTRRFLLQQSQALHFSQQDCRQLCEIALDFQMWGEAPLATLWPDLDRQRLQGKARKQWALQQLRDEWLQRRTQPNRYPADSTAPKISAAAEPCAIDKPKLGLGRCPVASPRTLCCNLQTLDAVDNCGYGCSYCSIQSFFDGKQIVFDRGFADKLKNLQLDPDKTYHIGTGQSSDSLMWGNSHGVLDAVMQFARDNPNVILELKTKSANVSHLLRNHAPANILCTWSLNTPTLIRHEEHGTAPLQKRLDAARRVADAGMTVGFHFHPIIHYDGWDNDYPQLVQQLVAMFDPAEVALVSLGTLTYIKSVMREIRSKAIPGQILKMPLVDADGKLSYPDDIKQALFHGVYDAFPNTWKQSVFYYLCMENRRFWKPLFGYEYASNEAFEQAMKSAYLAKIHRLRQHSS